jgi:hypothetical protein
MTTTIRTIDDGRESTHGTRQEARKAVVIHVPGRWVRCQIAPGVVAWEHADDGELNAVMWDVRDDAAIRAAHGFPAPGRTAEQIAADIAAAMAGDDEPARIAARAAYDEATRDAEETDDWDLVALIEQAASDAGVVW